MQHLQGLREGEHRAGAGQERQVQPWSCLQRTWPHKKSRNNQTKGFSGSPARAPLHPNTAPSLRASTSTHTGGALGCFAHQLISSTLSHQVPFYLPLPARNYSTSSTELFISLRGCHGAHHYGSQRPRKHLFAQSPDGFLKNCFPCSAARNTSHSSATTNWEGLFMPEQSCQGSRGWRGQLSAPRTRPRHSEALAGLWAVLGLAICLGHPQHPVSSLFGGFLAPGARGCDWDSLPGQHLPSPPSPPGASPSPFLHPHSSIPIPEQAAPPA